ncbi:Shedu immune nuclease family protein [Chryseobacterium sp. Leaf201]|uniref:Shedu immune nuclease family protein n=1 Tax=Chryseobacterium sp. Leaf201 TaxID=1735672 RepID=UPI0006F8CE4F|nr:Shedu immune nuclease family protein [Chryseobacterium sp. Leaf201]KQM56836.1 hypothetical protein ASE55_19375 [Chryseobacterium sp. Leaf201]
MKKQNNIENDLYYFNQRKPEKIYVSKAFPYLHFSRVITTEKRYIKKVFEKDDTSELVEVEGEIILKNIPTLFGKYQVNAVVYSKQDTNLLEFTLQKFIETKDQLRPVKDSAFSFTNREFTELLQFLSDVKFLDFNDKERFVIDSEKFSHHKILLNLTEPDPNKILVDKKFGDLINKLNELDLKERENFLETLKNKILTKTDLDILTGRKDGLEQFKNYLGSEHPITEIQWQDFFKNNSWIFGYGLDYKFLNILQKEASVSSVDVGRKNEVKADFLLGDNNFTVIVELKRPDTPLFDNTQNRSESWRLSKDLTYAVSQILTQKAEWELKSQHTQFDGEGNPIYQSTYNPKAILIIGNTKQFEGENKESLMKRKTFDLYRRNSRDIEIVTFDELLEKAKFIVSDNRQNDEVINLEENDDLPL